MNRVEQWIVRQSIVKTTILIPTRIWCFDTNDGIVRVSTHIWVVYCIRETFARPCRVWKHIPKLLLISTCFKMPNFSWSSDLANRSKSDLRGSDSTWLSQKIHVSKVLKLKNQNFNTSASKNIQNFENRANSEKVTVSYTLEKRCTFFPRVWGGEWIRSLSGPPT